MWVNVLIMICMSWSESVLACMCMWEHKQCTYADAFFNNQGMFCMRQVKRESLFRKWTLSFIWGEDLIKGGSLLVTEATLEVSVCVVVFMHVCEAEMETADVWGKIAQVVACVCVRPIVHLGADDSLGGSLYVGRQTKERRPVILWKIFYYTAVVLERNIRHITGLTQKQTHPHAWIVGKKLDVKIVEKNKKNKDM